MFILPKEHDLFLVPEMPTPNGRMHLGHIAGPYLKMDVLKRKAQRNGGTALIVSGSDVYESYVELKAMQTSMSEESVCNTFHKLIEDDLRALSIEIDLFINPLEEKYKAKFKNQHETLALELSKSNEVIEVEEFFPFDKSKNRYLTGCWLNGNCPICKNPTGSYLCENCGTHYKPSDIFSNELYPNAYLIKKKSIFLKLDISQLRSKLSQMGVSKSFNNILDKYCIAQENRVRLTTEQKTGIQYGPDNQVLYTYTALWFFSLFCGDVAKELWNLDLHPFHPLSRFRTIASFGIDNAIPYLGGVLGASLLSNGYKPFDSYLSNYFYYLNGLKFSTSRQHVIWGRDIVDKAGVEPDIIRYYLALTNPQHETKNFDVSEFVQRINCNLVNKHNLVLSNCLSVLKNSNVSDLTFLPNLMKDKLNDLLQEQNDFLDPSTFLLSELPATIEEWVNFYNNSIEFLQVNQVYWWLKGYALLAYPLMPNIAAKIWDATSNTKEITLERFFDTPFLNVTIEPFYSSISVAKMELCLNADSKI